MSVSYDNTPNIPKNCFLTRSCQEREDGYEVEFKEYTRYNNHVNGQIIIKNTSNTRIEDWSLILETNLSIENIWNANIVEYVDSFGCYNIENAGYNQNIEPGSSVEFGFIATYDNDVEITDYNLFEMVAVNYDDEDFEEEDDEQVIYDADYFECFDDYMDYLVEEGYITAEEAEERTAEVTYEENEATTPIKQRKSSTHQKVVPTEKLTLNFNENTRAVQNYMIDGNNMYIFQHKKKLNKKPTEKESSDIIVQKLKVNDAGNQYILPSNNQSGELLRFGHGQTMEKTGGYILSTGNGDNGYGKNLCFIKLNEFNKVAETGNILNYDSSWEKGPAYSPFKRLVNLSYANKKGKNIGKLARVDAALSEDQKVLAIWCRTKSDKLQISLYDFTVIRKHLIEAKANGISFNGKYKSKLMNACLASYQTTSSKGKNNILQPYGSLQGLDIKKSGNNKWDIYITSGNQYNKKAKKKTEKHKLYVSRFTLKKGKSAPSNQTQKVLTPKSTTNTGYLEVEGCHCNGNKLEFLITPSGTKGEKKADKQIQYISQIDLFE